MSYKRMKQIVFRAAAQRGVSVKGRGKGYLAALKKELGNAIFKSMMGNKVEMRAWTMMFQWINLLSRSGDFPASIGKLEKVEPILRKANKLPPGKKQAQVLTQAQILLKQVR